MFTQFIYMERNTKVWKPEQDANSGLPLAQLIHQAGVSAGPKGWVGSWAETQPGLA